MKVVGVDGISVGMIAEIECGIMQCQGMGGEEKRVHTVRIKRLFESGGIPAAEVESMGEEHGFLLTVQRTSLLNVRVAPEGERIVTIGLLREVQEGEKMCRHGNYGRCEVCEIEDAEVEAELGDVLETVDYAASLESGSRVLVCGGTFEYGIDGVDMPYRMLAFLVDNGGVIERTGL